MIKVRVYSRNTLIGFAELTAADPPMGVAAGDLIVTGAYDALRPVIDRLFNSEAPDWSALGLTVVTDAGEQIKTVGGIWIDDVIDNDLPPQVILAGIDGDAGLYETLFCTDPGYLSYWGGNP